MNAESKRYIIRVTHMPSAKEYTSVFYPMEGKLETMEGKPGSLSYTECESYIEEILLEGRPLVLTGFKSKKYFPAKLLDECIIEIEPNL